MSRTVDARGLNCPQPVILTKRVMDEKSGEEIVTMVDNPTALENVCKLAASQGYEFTVESQGSESHINMSPQKSTLAEKDEKKQDLVVLVKSEYFGQGDDAMMSWVRF